MGNRVSRRRLIATASAVMPAATTILHTRLQTVAAVRQEAPRGAILASLGVAEAMLGLSSEAS